MPWDVPFRDDREAARARIEQLEQELAQARSDLAVRRGSEAPHAESGAPGIGWGAGALFLAALLLLGGAAYAGLVVPNQISQEVALAIGAAGVLALSVAVLLQS